MNLKLLTDITRGNITLKKDEIYEVKEIIGKDYLIEIPMKQKGKTKRVIVNNDEAELVD